MNRAYHLSQYKDSHIAFWLVAYVHKLDTHATWSAKFHTKRDDGGPQSSDWLFYEYTCDISVLQEFIKRGIVNATEKAVKEKPTDIMDWAWEELTKTINACRPYISIPLSDDAAEHGRNYREPDPNLWFEIVIDSFTDETVKFSISTWGYKYLLTDLILPKQLYYLLADRLDAKIRFVHEWFALESISKRLDHAIQYGKILRPIAADLNHEIALLRSPSDAQIQSSCRSIFPLLERAMREHVESSLSGKKAGTLDNLVRQFESKRTVSPATIELLRFVLKPKRDYIEHGRTLPIVLAKIVLVTTLEILVHFGEIDT